MSTRFPLLTRLAAQVLDVTAAHPDGSIEVLARIGQTDVTIRMSRAQAVEADIIDRASASDALGSADLALVDEHVKAIRRNVGDWYADRITHAEFVVRSKRLHDSIPASVREVVLEALAKRSRPLAKRSR